METRIFCYFFHHKIKEISRSRKEADEILKYLSLINFYVPALGFVFQSSILYPSAAQYRQSLGFQGSTAFCRCHMCLEMSLRPNLYTYLLRPNILFKPPKYKVPAQDCHSRSPKIIKLCENMSDKSMKSFSLNFVEIYKNLNDFIGISTYYFDVLFWRHAIQRIKFWIQIFKKMP